MTDWADEKAREHMGLPLDAPEDHLSEIDAKEVRDLAALLREVRSPDLSQLHDEAVRLGYDAALDEVRKIVEDERCPDPQDEWEIGCQRVCDAILRRIEGLK